MTSASLLGLRPSPSAQLGSLARQSFRRMLHDPSALVVPLVFPLLILAINTAALHAAAELPGFPTHDIIDFAIGLTFVQGALFAAIPAATDLAVDLESGFLERVALAPVSAGVLLAARLTSVLALGLAQSACYLVVGLLTGARIAAGPAGIVALILLSWSFDLALVGVGFLLALRSRSGEAVQSLFPIFFVFLMLSSALMPRDLVTAEWFRVVAEVNPVSYMVEAVRGVFIDGWHVGALAAGAGVAGAIALLSGVACVRSLRVQMARR
jgi:ABC-2 type transport system permease protein